MRVLRQVKAPRFFNLSSPAVEPCDSVVPVNKDSLKKDDTSQRRVELEQRRGVEIFDGEPLCYSCSSPLTLRYNINYMNKNVVISEEEQKAYKRRQQMCRIHPVEVKIPYENGLPRIILQE
ncbi:hypothetical protein MKW98_015174 [Papaver atlanticum]|uniref:Uncharacterized protein n=1 Tax=Papaver atlanticum TaxID=357466 RepID=A0AAD4XTS6_9MAGN|nr:hypothetical protein MKW98_015174 [Papaver atlanticum]